jgi:chemotaxis protein MotB
MPAANQAPAPIIVKKIIKGGHGHHGGAWKVAYADFVTAMMAFFLLMWLINTTTPEQKRGIADFFAPASVSETTSGAGGLLAGQSLADAGARQAIETTRAEGASSGGDIQGGVNTDQSKSESQDTADSAADSQSQAKAMDNTEFARAEQAIRQAIETQPELAELSKQVVMDITPEGLRIQLIDEDGRSMFGAGDAKPTPRAERLMGVVSRVIVDLPNRVSVSGHTDSANPGRGISNWDLSSQRANVARRLLQANGVAGERVYQIIGKADSEPLFPEDPMMPGNRRVAITLLREAPVLPRDATP